MQPRCDSKHPSKQNQLERLLADQAAMCSTAAFQMASLAVFPPVGKRKVRIEILYSIHTALTDMQIAL